jgi:large subunit ribosomal protein L31e
MSQELERVYTINLGKVLLSPNNQRAKRAVNMVKEYARHHMKTQEVKIEESVNHQIWKRGIKHPPRKIRVRMIKTDEGFILVSPYEKEIEETVEPVKEKKMPAVEEKPEPETKIETSEEVKEEPAPTAKEPKLKEPTQKPKEPKAKAKEPTKKPKESKPKQKESKKPKAKESKSKESKKAKSKKDKPKKKSK